MAKSKQNRARFNQLPPRLLRVDTPIQITKEGLAIVQKLELIVSDANNTKKKFEELHPNWIESDVRLTVFNKLCNGLTVSKFSVVLNETSLGNNDWWKINFPTLTSADIKTQRVSFVRSAKHSLGMFLFILVENKFRIFLRAIDPLACSGGTESFESIYISLLRSKLSSPLSEEIELLELIRLVRNTVHNDGIYIHKKGLDGEITYKGVKYPFNNGKALDFVTWDFLLMLAADIHNLFKLIVLDKVISEITEDIIDPASKII